MCWFGFVLKCPLFVQLTKLQDENDKLVGKHSKTAQQLQNEDINLPNNLEVSVWSCSGSVTCLSPKKFLFRKCNLMFIVNVFFFRKCNHVFHNISSSGNATHVPHHASCSGSVTCLSISQCFVLFRKCNVVFINNISSRQKM